MEKIQSQGVHHITLVGANRQTSIDFWEGVLGMPFVFEQPNLDNPRENHIYFDPGDGRLITVFTNEDRQPDPERTSTEQGSVHHIAFSVSRASFSQAIARLDARGVKHTGVRDRGIFDAIYFQDPLGLLVELSCYKFEPPAGFTHVEVLFEAHLIRTARNDYAIGEAASGRCDRSAGGALAPQPVGGPLGEESVLTPANFRRRFQFRVSAIFPSPLVGEGWGGGRAFNLVAALASGALQPN